MQMTKNGSQYKILVFSCPYIPKAVFFDDYFSRERSRKELGYRSKFNSKKSENFKILTKIHAIYLKRKLSTCRIQIYVEKL
jgi:hypothetical protein